MADSRLVSAPPRPPRPAPRAHPLVLGSVDDPTLVEGPRTVAPPPLSEVPRRAPVEETAPARPQGPPHRKSQRSRAEKILFLVLLLGLGLNLGAFLIEGGSLSRLDLLLAGVILLSGGALLGLTEICRRSDRSARGS